MKTLRPDPRSVERLFKAWHGREPQKVRHVKPVPLDGSDGRGRMGLAKTLASAHFPEVVYRRGGCMRLWYLSDKKTPEGPSGVWASYVHCNVIETENGRDGECICGHVEHDALPGSLATVYDGEPNHDTAWNQGEDALRIDWPDTAAFLGYVEDWDEARSDVPDVHETRFAEEGWLLALDDRTAAVIRADGKVYVIYGGDLRIEARGLVG